jgi:uncharacterized protein
MMTISLLTFLAVGAVVAGAQPIPLKMSMISLGVKDTARSIKFYRETLGLQLVGQPGEVTIFQAGNVQISLNHPLGNAAGGTMVGAVEVVFSVDSVVAAHKALAERGCTFIREPREAFPGTWAATFTDPDGHRLTILGPR